MNAFNEAERKGREKLKRDYDNSIFPIDYYFTPDEYNKIDSFATAHTPGGDIKMANEVKNRDIYIASYSASGFILEVIKKDALMEAHDNSGYCPYYTNYFIDGRIVWDLRKIKDLDDRIITKECTRTTATNYGDRVPKKVILLYPNEGKITYYYNN